MPKNLVIVESPAKAKTIESFLGKDFVVKSSYGHIRDLADKGMAVDIENDFTPHYEISADKKKLVTELKKLCKEMDIVWLASDEDREGEAIAWHLYEALGLNEEKTKRIVFNEITKTAITKAIENPRKIDKNLVDAQQARRVLDRLVGYELSPVLWKKIKPNLSAGRVQSVAVRLIVDRERERIAFKPETFYKTTASFISKSGGKNAFKAELNKKFKLEDEVEGFLTKASNAIFTVNAVEKKPAKKSPPAPFTTSTLQQEASRKLGFSVSRTMRIAQKLYEDGHITYMRTDSVNLSDFALQSSKDAILSMFGNKYHKSRKFSTKSKSAQEAHEAIRPTNFNISKVEGDISEQRLYELIWKRTLASQMADAEIEKTEISIGISNCKEIFLTKGEVITFDGFLKLYIESTDSEDQEDEAEENQLLPNVKSGDEISAIEIISTQRFTQPPPRYTEASLVKKLEELGIGRPSTYAPIISTVQNRGYVEKKDKDGEPRNYNVFTLKNGNLLKEQKTENTGAEKSKLFPTDIGVVVNDFLVENFSEIVDYNFTATVEKEFDEIAEGKIKWKKMLYDFYEPFHKEVENAEKNAGRVKGKRELGIDPKSGKPVYALIGRYGPMVQIGNTEDEEKPKFSSLQPGQSIETITLEMALKLFELPMSLGYIDNQEVVVSDGKFGPYIKFGKLFVSIPKTIQPTELTLDEAKELIEKKIEAEKNKYIAQYEEEDIAILNGRFGPYIVHKGNNYKIPKDKDAKLLTLDEIKALIAAQPQASKPKYSKKKK